MFTNIGVLNVKHRLIKGLCEVNWSYLVFDFT